jgi:hypothetical protein
MLGTSNQSLPEIPIDGVGKSCLVDGIRGVVEELGAAVVTLCAVIAMLVSECLAQRRRREAMEKAGVAKASIGRLVDWFIFSDGGVRGDGHSCGAAVIFFTSC